MPNHLAYYKFFGIIMGKALLDKWVVDIDLAMPIFKLLLNKKLYL